MRMAVLFLLPLLLAPSVDARALVSCDSALVGSAPCPHPWIGPTAAAYPGAAKVRPEARVVLGGSLGLDCDADLVPPQFDNCECAENGPDDGSNQVDTDLDGCGNACAADYDQDGSVTSADFAIFLAAFGGVGTLADHDGDGYVTVSDFGIFLSHLVASPGPSGLSCADPTLRVPPDAPCRL